MISQNKSKGFTIVELLIVIVIIGILAAISIVAYNGVMTKSRDSERKSDARNIANAASAWKAEKDTWPTVLELQGFPTVKLSGKANTGLRATAVTSAADKASYGMTNCTSGTPATTTGVQISYWNETDAARVNVNVGTGCSA